MPWACSRLLLASLALCAGLALLAAPLPRSIAPCSIAEAQGGNPLVARGVGEYDELRFEEALQTFSAALVRSGNTDAELATIYRYLTLTYLALGRQEEAGGAYRHMLAVDPGYTPGSDIAPRFRDFLTTVRGEWIAEGRPGLPPPSPVAIQHRSPAQADRGTSVTLTATVDDSSGRVRSLVLAYRQGSEAVFTRIDCTRDEEGAYTATIPAGDVHPPLVEYYFEAIDEGGLPVASRGDVAAPLRIAVPAPGGDVTSEPLFWVGIVGGAVVIAGAIILGVVLGTQGGGEQPGMLRITIGD